YSPGCSACAEIDTRVAARASAAVALVRVIGEASQPDALTAVEPGSGGRAPAPADQATVAPIARVASAAERDLRTDRPGRVRRRRGGGPDALGEHGDITRSRRAST